MSLLNRVKKSTTAPTEDRDILGGRFVFETDVYPVEIKRAFLYESKKGSTGCRIEATTQDGKEYSTDLWITDRKGNNYSVNPKTKEQSILTGYTMLNSILLLSVGISLDEAEELELTEKTVAISKDNTQKVEVIDNLTGVNLLFAIQKIRKNKQKKVGEDYVPVNEIVFDNELVKVFCASEDAYGYTVTECDVEAEQPEFMNRWLTKNKGKDRDLYTEVSETASKPASGAAKSGLAARKPLTRANSTDDEGNAVASDTDTDTDTETEVEEPVAPATPQRKSFRRP